MDQPQATVVITTKNRKDELRNAIASALLQDIPIEVLVIDDGSTDGTSEMVRDEFPNVRVDRSETSRGLIVQRTRAASLVTTPYIVSIDDDAIFPTPGIIRQTIADFADDPRIGAVAMPYIDVKYSDAVRQRAPDDQDIWVVSEYRGTAHALRRELFASLGGYCDAFIHQCEEGEYCLRMLNAGYYVRLGRADPIHHLESPKRDRTRIFFYQTRNHILWAWIDVPLPALFVHLPATAFGTILSGFRSGYGWASIKGLFASFATILCGTVRRRAVSLGAYRGFREIRASSARLQ